MDDEIDEAAWNDEEMEEEAMDHSDDVKPEPSDDVIMHSSQGEEGSKDTICSDDSKMDKDNDFGDKDFEKAQIKNLREEDELTIEKIEDIDSVFEEYDKTSEKELTHDHCIVNKELESMENFDEMREEENNSQVDAFSNALHDVSNEFLISKNEINKAEKIHENVEIKKIRCESAVSEEDNTSVDCDKISKETSSQEQMTEISLATALNDRPVDEAELLVVGEKKTDVEYDNLSNDEFNYLENLLGISEMEATFSADVDSDLVTKNKTLVEDDKIINKTITDGKIETKLSSERVHNIDSKQTEQEIFETEQEVSNDKRKVFANYDKIVDESIVQEKKKEVGVSLTKIDDNKEIESSSLFEEKTFAEYDEIINAIITREKTELEVTSIITGIEMKDIESKGSIVEENKILADYDEIINATITKGKIPKKEVFSVNIGDDMEGSKPESLVVKENNTYDNYDKIINETIKKKMAEIEMSSTIGGDHYQSNNFRYENDDTRLDENLLFGSITYDKDLFTNDETKENKDDSNDLHSEGMKTSKLSLTKNHTEDFRGLDVQEGELDFEEEVHVEQNNSMSDLTIGELEQKERLNADIDDKTQDNEKGDDSKDDNDEGEVEDDEDLEEGELKDTNGMKHLIRPICRFYNKGHCTWGSVCRFIHPGFNDKGNYSMFADDKYGPGTNGPHPLQDSNHPSFAGPWLPETGSDGLPHPPPPEPIIESAWERGLRQAKELMKKANQRKESKPNYEEKRASITLEDQDIDKENEYQCRIGKTDSYFNYGYDDPRDYFEREQPYWQSGRYENIKFEVRWNRQPGFPPFRNREREKEPRPRPRETTPPPPERRREDRERWRHDRYTETTTSSSGNNKVRTRADEWRDPWRRSVSPKRHHSASPRRRSRSRGNDRSRRSYSSGSSASYSSSGSSRSRSSSYSSYSGSSSGSSYYSSNRSYSRSRSRSRSRTPLRNKRNIPAPTLPLTKKRPPRPTPPPRPPPERQPSSRPPSSRLPSSRAIPSRPLSTRPLPSNEPRSQISQVKSKNRIQSPERKKNISLPQTTVPAPVRGRPSENKPIRKTERRSEKRSRSREWSRSKSYSSHSGSSSSRSRSLSVSSVSSNHSSSTSASADSQHMYARMGSPANSKSRSPPPPPPPPPAPPLPGRKEEKPRPDKKRKPPLTNLEGKFPIPILDTKIIDSKLKSSMNAPVANRAKDPLKHSGHKPIKLTLLSKPSEKPSATNVFKKDVLDISVKNLATASPKPTFVDKVDRKILKAAMSSLKTEMRPPKSPSPNRSPINNSKNISDRKRPTSSPPLMAPPAKISLPTIVPSKSITSKKTTSSRREELLKQLKAVEDAIARKRSKLS